MTKNQLFTLDMKTGIQHCLKLVIKNDSWLWHLRFGDLDFTGLKLLSKKSMAEAMLCAVYLLNRCPTKVSNSRLQMKHGAVAIHLLDILDYLEVLHMHMFQIKKERSLMTKAKGVSLSDMTKEAKTYRLYNPLTKEVIISRDVEFDEKDYWRWSTGERNVAGLFFNDDDEDVDSNTKDGGNDDLTPPQSPIQQTPQSTPTTSGNNNNRSNSSNSGGEQRKT
ncbi:hypothetical protein LIER_37532 [Lithospermum erythrorhizon]|uniref:Retroviral polymerase SH3-like domain-containing protein n=1 Tax=Lithospermum erythrorhizon TaxID=34254 RepID=A0AAV3PNQ9_LITER